MEKYYFFPSNRNLEPPDIRQYSHADWSKVLSKFLESGIYNEGDHLKVTSNNSGMNVIIGTGLAFLDGYMYENDSPLTLNVDAAEATMDRIDIVVLRLDLTEQNRHLKSFVVKGEASTSPIAPLPQDTIFVKEIVLAEVLVTAGKSIIEQSQISDRRPTDLVDPFVDGTRLTNLENKVNEHQAEFTQFEVKYKEGIMTRVILDISANLGDGVVNYLLGQKYVESVTSADHGMVVSLKDLPVNAIIDYKVVARSNTLNVGGTSVIPLFYNRSATEVQIGIRAATSTSHLAFSSIVSGVIRVTIGWNGE